MTRRQNNNHWSGGIAAHSAPPQNILSAKILWKISRLFFLDQYGILLVNYLPKGQTIHLEYYSSLLVQLKDILKEIHRGRSPRWSCSCMKIPRLTGHFQPRRNWPNWASSFLIAHPILWIWLRLTTTYSMD